MTFRKILFWAHLAAGLIAGLSIFTMCFTGTVLAFEKPIVDFAERDVRRVTPATDASRQTLAELQHAVRIHDASAHPSAIIVSADPADAVVFQLGRDGALYANPYTGEIRAPTGTRTHDFMRAMENWHRWLALGGDGRAVGKIINGAGNFAFFFLAVSGLFLWMPRRWSWRSIRAVALFNLRLTGKNRDFNWHNTIGLWCAPVLIVLTLTALPMSYRWANNLVYALAGEAAPARPSPGGTGAPSGIVLPAVAPGTRPIGPDALLAVAQREFPEWQQITLRLSGDTARRSGGETRTERTPQPVALSIKTARTWPRTAGTTLTLNPFTGAILQREAFADLSAGRRLRTWSRFLHTGEALGWGGQLVAGLACLGGCFLVYTGFALAWRRFFGRATDRAIT